MFKLRRIGAMALLVAGIIGLAACNDESKDSANMQLGNETPVTESSVADTKGILSSITVDASGAKTKFYLGDEFTSEGITVTSNYTKVVDGKPQGYKEACTGYYINAEEVNMNLVGSYPVEVVYREGTRVRTATYIITVVDSIFNDSGVKYCGGIDITYGTDGFIEEVLVGTTYSFNKNGATCTAHFFQNVDGKLVETTESVNVRRYVDVDYSQVDTSKVGTYMVKYSYNAGDVTIDGVQYPNIVTSFTLVNVVNPIVSFSKSSTNDTTFAASFRNLDFSNWEFEIEYEVGGVETVKFSDDLFVVSGVCSFASGAQTALVNLKSDMTKFVRVDIEVTESTTQNITVIDRLDYGMTKAEDGSYSDKPSDTTGNLHQLDQTGLCYGAMTAREQKVFVTTDNIPVYVRTKIDTPAKGGKFQINMENSGAVVIYMSSSSSGDLNRVITVTDENGDTVAEFITSTYNNPVKYVFEVDAAGKYTITGNSFYVHGLVVITDKA